jgi:hypothetical protein
MMKKEFTEPQARHWILSHGFKLKKKDIIQNYPTEFRYTQIPKQEFKRFITKVLNSGVHLVLGAR